MVTRHTRGLYSWKDKTSIERRINIKMNIINIKRQSHAISSGRNLKVISLWKPTKFDANAVVYEGI